MLLELIALAVVAVAVAVVLVHRSTLAQYLPGVPFYEHHPYYGVWPVEMANIDRYYDWKLSQAERAQSEGHEILQRVGPFLSAAEVHSPRMLQYILKDNFDNFESQSAHLNQARQRSCVMRLHFYAPVAREDGWRSGSTHISSVCVCVCQRAIVSATPSASSWAKASSTRTASTGGDNARSRRTCSARQS